MRFRLLYVVVPLSSLLTGTMACTPIARSKADHVGAAPVLTRPPLAGALTGVTAFVGANVVPMDTERVLTNQTVLVEGGWITALGPASEVKVPSGAVQIDGRGKYLIPGLADMHAHIKVGSNLAMAERRLFLWVANGLTTARILDHSYGMGPEVLQLRARAAAGELLSPRIYTAGYLGGRGKLLLSPEEIVDVVTAYKASGYDFIKVHNVHGHGQVFDSLAATARRVGLPLVGHAVVELKRVLPTFRSIEHLFGYFPSTPKGWGEPGELDYRDSSGTLGARIRELAVASQRAGVWNCPTQYNSTMNARMGGGGISEQEEKELAARRQLIKALQDAGAGLLLGSDRLQVAPKDAPDPRTRKFNLRYLDPSATHRELQALVEAGLTPYQALVTGTRNVATYFGTLAETGTVAVSKRADLLLLNGNPLGDIHHTTQSAGVMLGGRWLAREEIDQRIAAFKAEITVSP